MRDVFPGDYRSSRAAFLESCGEAGARLASHEHPQPGSDCLPVYTDVAAFGGSGATRVLVVVSGVHGVEGLCGAGVQLDLLRRGLHHELGQRLRLVLVHALNPHGFLELSRGNERNVDLNRNFLDHRQPHPLDAGYAELHALLVPADWDGPARRAADAALERLAAERGAAALRAAICAGQYTHADGLFYGGTKPAWSNRLWRDLLAHEARTAEQVAVIDLHSGLGARGACELISGATPGSAEQLRAREWFGERIVFPGSTSTAPAAAGYMGTSLADLPASTRSALVVAEFGTVAFAEVLTALRADCWRRSHAVRPALLGEIRAALDAAFVGRDAAWQAAVLEQGAAICRRALRALDAAPPGAASMMGATA